jgi:hypothetical protein
MACALAFLAEGNAGVYCCGHILGVAVFRESWGAVKVAARLRGIAKPQP